MHHTMALEREDVKMDMGAGLTEIFALWTICNAYARPLRTTRRYLVSTAVVLRIGRVLRSLIRRASLWLGVGTRTIIGRYRYRYVVPWDSQLI